MLRALCAFARNNGCASIHFPCRLQRPSVAVVERFMQQEDLLRPQAQILQLSAQVLKCAGVKRAADERADVVAAQVHFHGGALVEWEGYEAERADPPADDARLFFGP